ncbi:MAG: hypothetical protein PHT54_02055 [Candidatus Nanoarchaeia archaeon]|nr:hypothetical protein [Candidatus Nanoarchaeia archaeon]
MKINFVYAFDYDRMLTLVLGERFCDEQILEMRGYLHDVEEFWKKEQNSIINQIEKIAGMRFKGDADCYLVKDMFYTALSHPMTIKKEDDFDKSKAILIHELIHVLFVQNKNKGEKMLRLLNEMFPGQDMVFRAHFPLLLVERKVIESIYGDKFMKKVLEMDRHSDELDYVWKEANKVYKSFNSDVLSFLGKCYGQKNIGLLQ